MPSQGVKEQLLRSGLLITVTRLQMNVLQVLTGTTTFSVLEQLENFKIWRMDKCCSLTYSLFLVSCWPCVEGTSPGWRVGRVGRVNGRYIKRVHYFDSVYNKKTPGNFLWVRNFKFPEGQKFCQFGVLNQRFKNTIQAGFFQIHAKCR